MHMTRRQVPAARAKPAHEAIRERVGIASGARFATVGEKDPPPSDLPAIFEQGRTKLAEPDGQGGNAVTVRAADASIAGIARSSRMTPPDQLFRVVAVGGQVVRALDDLVGPTSFEIDCGGGEIRRINGIGLPGSSRVLRVRETGAEDGRIWEVTAFPGGGFVAYRWGPA